MSEAFIKGLYGIHHINDPDVKLGMKEIVKEYEHKYNIPEGTKLTDTQRTDISGLLADYLLEVGGKYYGRGRA